PSPETVAGWLAAVARAVAHIHVNGVVHRDLKPSNVLLAPDGRPVLADFGLALLDDEEAERLTRSGAMLGTPLYMAPEQARGDRRAIGGWTDVHALGAVGFALLTKQSPFSGGSAPEVIAKVTERVPPPAPRAPRALAAILARALEKEPA